MRHRVYSQRLGVVINTAACTVVTLSDSTQSIITVGKRRSGFRPREFPRDLPYDEPDNNINSEQGLDTDRVIVDVEARRVTPNRNRPIAHNTDQDEDDIFSDDSVMD
ncbi:hypothetical protein DPMN_040027 [Dreissena polymorpha]|uniref:Uncharacterized protein n=1 Tax=Dreissena polymorpha TaxID=45954 RepID=A0A9D4CX12_DREPO|nr:hypothetical protein DPMN_040027 [Dreissena polymorpha]